MKLLFISVIDLSANSSAGAETINIYIDQFSRMQADIHVISKEPGRNSAKNIQYHILDKSKKRRIHKIIKAAGWVAHPSQKYLYKTSKKIRENIYKILMKLKKEGYYPDAIILETTSVVLMVDDIKSIYPKSIYVASMHDVSYQGSIRKAMNEKNIFMKHLRNRYIINAKRIENMAMSNTDLIVAHNGENITWLKREKALSGKKFIPISPYYENDFCHDDYNYNKNIIFYGLMGRPENYESAIWFIDNVVPCLSKEHKFIVMGGNPPQKLLDRQSSQVIVTGFVSQEEVKQYFEKSFCMVAPLLFGSGIKTKILSALSAGLPVLTNKIGIEGISATDKESFFLCETPQDYLDAINQLLNTTIYKSICEKSRLIIDRKYNHYVSAQNYLGALNDIINGKM